MALTAAMIAGILMHSGNGGGLSDMFGGGMGAAARVRRSSRENLDRHHGRRSPLIFGFTTIGLGLLLSTPADCRSATAGRQSSPAESPGSHVGVAE